MGLALLTLMLAAQAADPPAQPVPQKPKLICRESDLETGSHIHSGRRCKTEEEWRQEDADRGRPASMRITEGQPDALTKQRPPQ